MPGTTATQGLIYPVGTDRMCDGASQLEVLAKGINGRITVLDALVDQGEEPPMALVEFLGGEDGVDAFEVSTNGGTYWNTVRIDDADAFDAGVSSVSLKLPYIAPGQLWEVGMYGEGEWVTQGAAAIDSWTSELVIRDSLGNIIHWAEESRFVGNTDQRGAGSIVALYETAGEDTIAATWSHFSASGSLTPVIIYAQLWAIQVSVA